MCVGGGDVLKDEGERIKLVYGHGLHINKFAAEH